MTAPVSGPESNPFFTRFPEDPACIGTLADIDALERIPAEQRFPCKTIRDAFTVIARQVPDNTALTFLPNGRADDTPQRWTYSQYQREIIAAANLFHELGLGYDESVAFLLPNIPQMLFGFWGAEAAGIAAPINPFLHPDQIAAIAAEADTRVLQERVDRGGEYCRKALVVQEQYPFIQHVITVGGAVEGTLDWDREVARQPGDAFSFQRPLSGTETAAYFHTGGTTGTPKLARHTHRAQVVNVGQMALTGPAWDLQNPIDAKPNEPNQDTHLSESNRDTHLSAKSVILCGLPLFHVNAVFVSAASAMIGGGELLLAGPMGFRNKALIQDFWQLVEQYGVSFFAGVPTIYASLLEQCSSGRDLSSLTHCGCGAAPAPASLLRDFRDRTGANLMEGYGMTETTVCATTHYYHGELKVGSIGMRLPYQNIRIAVLTEEGAIERECERDEIGVLLLNGPNMIPEYKQSEANLGAWPEPGWLNSGDLGRLDADGFVWLTGRAKDLIIRGGHNIDPLITESALISHPDVEMAAAVGKPDAYAGELPVAYVQLRPGATVTAGELKAYARERAAERAAAPADVIISNELPKTAVGKLFKPELRKDAIARAFRETVENGWPDSRVFTKVLEHKVKGLVVHLQLMEAEAVDLERMGGRLDKLGYVWEVDIV
ncbi:MAG: AMP-binding protein [Exilibacterium sp.]